MKAYFKNLILGWTHRLWNRQIVRILCRAYSDRIINHQQLHILAEAFDPTQKHRVYGKYEQRGFLEDKEVKVHVRSR